LADIAPEFSEWAEFFAAGATKRAAAEAGLRGVVTAREADDLVREVEQFLGLVARQLGAIHQPLLSGMSSDG
jgi:regulator of protease activity HflC (stomatin/prohibitin superfamily)